MACLFFKVGLVLFRGHQRLDFTVVGRDVNLTSRLSGLNKVLAEPVLMTRAFAEHFWTEFTPVGAFALDGIPGEVSVLKP